jgi:phosphoglycerate dehydrogenase-like enzyme
MVVQAWSQNLDPDYAQSIGVKPVQKDELFATSDVVSLHLRLSERSRGIVGTHEFDLMPSNAVLINTSRGPLVDQAALLRALESRRIAGAGLDVFDTEPLPAGHPYLRAPNTVLTPHLGYVTHRAYQQYYGDAVEDIQAWLSGAPIRQL